MIARCYWKTWYHQWEFVMGGEYQGNQVTRWGHWVFFGSCFKLSQLCLGVCVCGFDHHAGSPCCFLLLSLVLAVSVNRKEMWEHTRFVFKSHTLISLSHTHTHTGEGRFSLRHWRCSGDEWCGRSCRQFVWLFAFHVKRGFCKQLETILPEAEGILEFM